MMMQRRLSTLVSFHALAADLSGFGTPLLLMAFVAFASGMIALVASRDFLTS